jgi:hypothetical protein
MATIGANVPTLLDHAKRLDPDGKVARIAELLSENNEIMNDIPFVEGNLPTGHVGTVRTGLPTVYWRLLNQGIQPSKSTTAQITEACGILEARSHVDIDLASLNGEQGAFRLSEASAFIESMTQEFVQTLFYGSASSPEEFIGLSNRLSSSSSGNSADNVLDAGGTDSDNSSIWLIGWSKDTCFGIYPKGSKAGLSHEDLGKQLIHTGTNGVDVATMHAYVDKWQMKAGLFLKDWRYVCRIANVDISNLVAETSAADLTKLMIKAIHRIPNPNKVKLCFYANRSVIQMLDIQRRDNVQDGGGLTYGDEQGQPVLRFRGIPVRLCDQLTEAESSI